MIFNRRFVLGLLSVWTGLAAIGLAFPLHGVSQDEPSENFVKLQVQLDADADLDAEGKKQIQDLLDAAKDALATVEKG